MQLINSLIQQYIKQAPLLPGLQCHTGWRWFYISGEFTEELSAAQY